MKLSAAENAAVTAVATPKPMTRNDVTDLIYSAKVQKGITWVSVAKKLRHHERHRLQDGHRARGRPEGGPRGGDA